MCDRWVPRPDLSMCEVDYHADLGRRRFQRSPGRSGIGRPLRLALRKAARAIRRLSRPLSFCIWTMDGLGRGADAGCRTITGCEALALRANPSWRACVSGFAPQVTSCAAVGSCSAAPVRVGSASVFRRGPRGRCRRTAWASASSRRRTAIGSCRGDRSGRIRGRTAASACSAAGSEDGSTPPELARVAHAGALG